MKTVGIVLAAGEGARLQPTVPPFHKPLLVVNGSTLVQSAAVELSYVSDETIVVVAPANAQHIVAVVGDEASQYIVQPKPVGPGEALNRAITHLDDEDTIIVLMGDNSFGPGDVRSVADGAGVNTVGSATIVRPKSESFTRKTHEGVWREGPYSDVEKLYDRDADQVWLGPLKMNVGEWRKANKNSVAQNYIGPALRHLESGTYEVECSTNDIGILEMLP